MNLEPSNRSACGQRPAPAHNRFFVAIAAAFLCLCQSTVVVAAEDRCRQPDRPALSNSISSERQVTKDGGKVEVFLGDSVQYLQCLITYAQENADTLTQKEMTSLKNRHQAHLAIVRDISTGWNQRYSAYLASQ